MARDYVFYGVGFDPQRFRVLVVPARRLLRRLLRPVFYRQVELFTELGDELDQLKEHVARVERRLDALDDDIQTTAALGWDHVAVTRRLAALEDRMSAQTNGEAQEATTSGAARANPK